MGKLLIICGPTAVGKTSLAIELARTLEGELVSADSKQVYKGLDIGTGKDIPPQAKRKGFYLYKGVKIWGYDLVGASQDYSVAQFVAFAQDRIKRIRKDGKLPILVGGTGLYIRAIVDGIGTVEIPNNNALRKNLAEKEVQELFELLAQLDPIKEGSLNASDKKNPRRLIRAIEIATWRLNSGGRKLKQVRPQEDALFIGLIAPKKVLYERIDKRVETRLRAGIIKEITALLKSGGDWDNQSMSSLGYRQWREYFAGVSSKEEVVKLWKVQERKYAKRQITWFKKDLRIIWFDVVSPGWREKVEKLVKKWYKLS